MEGPPTPLASHAKSFGNLATMIEIDYKPNDHKSKDNRSNHNERQHVGRNRSRKDSMSIEIGIESNKQSNIEQAIEHQTITKFKPQDNEGQTTTKDSMSIEIGPQDNEVQTTKQRRSNYKSNHNQNQKNHTRSRPGVIFLLT
jgi:hypothetical protein